MSRVIPCVLMRAGTSRGPFFLREWLPSDEAARDEALIGASNLLQVADKEIQKNGPDLGKAVLSRAAELEPGFRDDGFGAHRAGEVGQAPLSDGVNTDSEFGIMRVSRSSRCCGSKIRHC